MFRVLLNSVYFLPIRKSGHPEFRRATVGAYFEWIDYAIIKEYNMKTLLICSLVAVAAGFFAWNMEGGDTGIDPMDYIKCSKVDTVQTVGSHSDPYAAAGGMKIPAPSDANQNWRTYIKNLHLNSGNKLTVMLLR